MSFPHYPDYKDSGVAWLGLVPSHWQVHAIKRLAHLQSGEAITAESIEQEGDYPVFGGGGLRGFADKYTHDGYHVLIGRQGALCGNVNYARGKFWASEHAVVVTPRTQLITGWIGEVLRVMNLNQYSVSAAQPGLSVDLIERLKVAVPTLEEQRTIAAFLEGETAKIDALVAEQARLISLLREKRQAILSQLVIKGLKTDASMKPSGVEWMGEVPAHWRVVPIRSVARLESGHTPSRQRPEWWENCTIPWFSLADIWQIREGGADVITETAENVSELGLANSSARLLPAGTVMLSRTASVGFSAIMGVPMATTQDFANWVCGPELLPEYLLQFFRAMIPEFERMKMGSTHNTIYMPDLQAFRCALPPVDEQRAIVSEVHRNLEQLDNLANEARRASDLLRERREALVAATVTGQIDVRGLPTEAAA